MENDKNEIMFTLAVMGERLERAEVLAANLTDGDFGYSQEHHIKNDGQMLIYNYPEHRAVIGVLRDYLNLCAEDADKLWKALGKLETKARNQ